MSDFDEFVPGVFIGIAIGAFFFVVFYCDSVHHITSFQERPYCVTKTISGKKFKRCLMAVEVPAKEEEQ